MERAIPRPGTVAAERAAHRNAEDSMTFSAVDFSGFGARVERAVGFGAFPALDDGCSGAGAGAASTRFASRSYAESRSTVSAYLACSGEPATAAVSSAGSAGAI